MSAGEPSDWKPSLRRPKLTANERLVAGLILAALSALLLSWMHITARLPSWGSAVEGIGFMALVIAQVFLPSVWISWRERRLWQAAEAHENMLCPMCRYPVPDAGDETLCPECGLRASAEELRRHWRHWSGRERAVYASSLDLVPGKRFR